MNRASIQILRDILGESVRTDTSFVLTHPTSATMEVARAVVEELPIDAVLRDVGEITAAAIATLFGVRGLRPADYADMAELPEMLAKAISKALADKVPDSFRDAFVSGLRLRG